MATLRKDPQVPFGDGQLLDKGFPGNLTAASQYEQANYGGTGANVIDGRPAVAAIGNGVRTAVMQGSDALNQVPFVRDAAGVMNNINAAGADLIDQPLTQVNRGLRYVLGNGVPEYNNEVRNAGVRAGVINNSTLAPVLQQRSATGAPVDPAAQPWDGHDKGGGFTPPAPSAYGTPWDGHDKGPRVAPDSPLDASAPLPAGVRQLKVWGSANAPGTNDVIYSKMGKNGVPEFSNNQFNTGGLSGAPIPGRADKATLTPDQNNRAQMRSNEIGKYMSDQAAAASAAQHSGELQPHNLADLKVQAETERVKAEAARATGDNQYNEANRTQELQAKVFKGITDQSDAVMADAKANNMPLEEAQKRAANVAARAALDQGYDVDSPGLPAIAKQGIAGVKKQFADKVNNAGMFNRGDWRMPWDQAGQVTDPLTPNLADYQVGDKTWAGNQSLVGPSGADGAHRESFVSPDEAALFSSYINSAKRGALKRKSLISDKK